MAKPKHIIVYSHGFGVRKDDGGLLTDIAQSLPEVESVLFDYFKVDDDKRTLTMCSFSQQAAKLKEVLERTRQDNPEAIIDVIAHSQGTLIPALVDEINVRKVILLSPVLDMSLERTLKRYQNRPGTEINLNGMSKLGELYGYYRFVPAEYWEERQKLQVFKLYNDLAQQTEVIMIIAAQDEILEPVDTSGLDKKIRVILQNGSHNFGNQDRQPLIALLRSYILES